MPSYYIDSNTGQRVEVKKTHRVRNFVVLPLVGVFVIVLVGAAITSGNSTGGSAPVNSAPPTSTTSPGSGVATAEILGEGEATVAIFTGGSSSNTVQLPHTVDLPEGMVMVTASRMPSTESVMEGKPDTGEIRCRIIRDGEVVDDQAAAGEWASVTCNKYR